MEKRATLLARLKEAENALHELNVTGAVRTFVDQNGERIEYNTTNTSRLHAYILRLKVELGFPVESSPPMVFYF